MAIFKDGMTALRKEVEARDSYTLNEAKTYAERALFIIVEHQKYDYQLGTSIVSADFSLVLIISLWLILSERKRKDSFFTRITCK